MAGVGIVSSQRVGVQWLRLGWLRLRCEEDANSPGAVDEFAVRAAQTVNRNLWRARVAGECAFGVGRGASSRLSPSSFFVGASSWLSRRRRDETNWRWSCFCRMGSGSMLAALNWWGGAEALHAGGRSGGGRRLPNFAQTL